MRGDPGPLAWPITVGLVTAALAAALLLIAALALGWNDPRPRAVPDWEDPLQTRHLAAAANQTKLALLGQAASDFTFEVIARELAGPDSGFYGYGVVYRARDLTHYYTFAVGGDGYYAIVRVDGGEEVPLVTWQQFPHVQRGRAQNRLRVTCAGATCDFTINDEYAATVEDDTWLTGDIGLWASSYEEEIAVQFRSARLWTADDRPVSGLSPVRNTEGHWSSSSASRPMVIANSAVRPDGDLPRPKRRPYPRRAGSGKSWCCTSPRASGGQ